MNAEKYHVLINSTIDTPELSFKGKTFLCKVVDVYDGDTVKVIFYLNDTLYRWTVRLYGINTPELRPPKLHPLRMSIKANAIKSRDYLKSLFLKKDNIVYIKCDDFDKYGRLLGIFFLEEGQDNFDDSINDHMVLSGHAKSYIL